MLKFIIIILCAFSTLHFPTTCYGKKIEQTAELYCCPELREPFALLREMQEVNDLIQKILEDGPLSIEINHHMSNKFEGYWSTGDRTIYITKNNAKAAKMTTILFEMHNALNDAQLEYFDSLAYHGQIKRATYIRSVEYWEYKNAKATTTIINKGIANRIFPQECYWPISDNFEEHLRIQQSAGHSAHIGQMYDSIR